MTATPASLSGAYVGTSGWSYPSWRPDFYPVGTKPEEFLHHYAEHFTTVELNTTGYRLPREELFERWADQTPKGFRFAPKLNAHRRSDFGTFAERVGLLGKRLGPIRVLVAAARDDGLLALVLGSFDPSVALAFDFRHESWDGIEADLPPNAVRVGSVEGGAPFRYLRLREPPYDDSALEEWAVKLRPLLVDGVCVYLYFKHEDEPTAPRYALRLLELLAS
ncbi:MAG TPA: DUF72 domain-containing protein [Gaiellaceae bacterium]|nr:DUF72 domain-containing protein [Gaiellaceae bacterium]